MFSVTALNNPVWLVPLCSQPDESFTGRSRASPASIRGAWKRRKDGGEEEASGSSKQRATYVSWGKLIQRDRCHHAGDPAARGQKRFQVIQKQKGDDSQVERSHFRAVASFNWRGANGPTWTQSNSDAKSREVGRERATAEPPLGSQSIIPGSD